MPALSVLMPVYNAERFLKEAIDSILCQSFTDFEFIIINDGSTDSSSDIVRSYEDKRIVYVENEKNLGITATLNKGIELASCELIARMDSDDISHPGRLQTQYDYFKNNPDCALLSSWMSKFNMTNNRQKVVFHESKYCYFNLIFNCCIHHPTVMYKRSIVKDVGMYSFRYAEDYSLWCDISRKYKIHILPEVLLKYRESDASLSKVTKKKEYEKAHDDQMLRNIKFYAGNDYQISENEIRFLRGYYTDLLHEGNRKLFVDSFRKLDHIISCVQKVDNVNKTSNQVIREAGFRKKARLVYELSKHINKKALLSLLVELRYWRLLFKNIGKILIGRYSLTSLPSKSKEDSKQYDKTIFSD